MMTRAAIFCVTMAWLTAPLLLAACSDSDEGSNGAGGSTSSTGTPCASEDDCFGATSHCDTARGVCTGCSNDDDCRGALKCDTATGICRDCVTDADCFPTAPRCDAVSGQCTASCSTNADCAGTQGPIMCDTARGVCVDCTTTIGTCFCELVTFSCVGCLQDSDCPATEPFCGPAHECSPSCSADTDCPAGLHCDSASERCVECAKNAHCPLEICQANYTCG